MPVLKSKQAEIFFLIVSLLYLALGSNYSFNIYDEGVAVTGALRVANGEIPYRDFWTMYAPGQYYFLAGIFKAFGQSLIVERIFSVLILWGIAATAWKISQLFLSKNAALFVLFLVTLWLGSYKFYGSPLASGLLLSLAGMYFALLFFKNNRQKDLFFAGIFCGVTAVFRHDLGTYTIIAIFFTIFGRHFRSFKTDVFKKVFKDLLLFISAICIIILPVAAYFLSEIPLKTLTDQLIIFPSTTFAEYRELPFPVLSDLFKSDSLKQIVKTALEICSFSFPIAVFVSMILLFLKRIFRKNPVEHFPPISGAALLTFSGVLFLMQVSIRADVAHLLPAMIPATILALFLFKNPGILPRFKNVMMILICFLAIGAFTGAAYTKAMLMKDMVLQPKFSLKTGRAAWISGDEFLKEYGRLLEFLKENTAKNERIFIGNMRHDKLSGNDAMLYFLSNRLPATKYHELHPGLVTEEKIQREIIGGILKNNVQTIVLREEILTVTEPNKSSVSSGVFLLDTFFKNNFSAVSKFGDYTVLKRVEN